MPDDPGSIIPDQDRARALEDLANLGQFVLVLQTLQQDVVDGQADLDQVRVEGRPLVETKDRVVPVEQALDRLFGLGRDEARDILLGQGAHLDQHDTEVLAVEFLPGQSFL